LPGEQKRDTLGHDLGGFGVYFFRGVVADRVRDAGYGALAQA
jgi:hypothetical protein